MTWIFQTMSGKPDMVNEYANRIFSTEPQLKFSDVFSPFFGNISSNMLSWIDVFSNNFDMDQVKNDALHNWRKSAEGESVNKTVDEMFTQLMNKEDLEQAHQDVDEQNIRRLKQFYICLFYIYKLLEQQGYNRNDAPFNFMNGFSVQETRVVILGNEPAAVDSSGYAFHESFCESTMELLRLINFDMKLLSKFLNNSFEMTEEELNKAQAKCSLQGLINQGVLFMNVKFTLDYDDKLKEALEIPIDFLLEYLSKQPSPNVFILAGRVAWEKERLIYQNANLYMKVYHPSFYSPCFGNCPKPLYDWNFNAAFVNANLFIYQTIGSQGMIDWSDVSGKKPGKESRLDSMARAFGDISPNLHPFVGFCIYEIGGSPPFYLLKPNTKEEQSLQYGLLEYES